jgi:hypothetical protein
LAQTGRFFADQLSADDPSGIWEYVTSGNDKTYVVFLLKLDARRMSLEEAMLRHVDATSKRVLAIEMSDLVDFVEERCRQIHVFLQANIGQIQREHVAYQNHQIQVRVEDHWESLRRVEFGDLRLYPMGHPMLNSLFLYLLRFGDRRHEIIESLQQELQGAPRS